MPLDLAQPPTRSHMLFPHEAHLVHHKPSPRQRDQLRASRVDADVADINGNTHQWVESPTCPPPIPPCNKLRLRPPTYILRSHFRLGRIHQVLQHGYVVERNSQMEWSVAISLKGCTEIRGQGEVRGKKPKMGMQVGAKTTEIHGTSRGRLYNITRTKPPSTDVPSLEAPLTSFASTSAPFSTRYCTTVNLHLPDATWSSVVPRSYRQGIEGARIWERAGEAQCEDKRKCADNYECSSPHHD